MRKIKVRNRVYSRMFGTGTVISTGSDGYIDHGDGSYFCVRFDKPNEKCHDGYDFEFPVKDIPKEWRENHCRFCTLLKEGQRLEMADGDTVVKVEGTGVISYLKKHFLKVVDEDGNLVADHVGVTTINGWPYYVSLSKTLEDIASPMTIYGIPCLCVCSSDAFMHLQTPLNKEMLTPLNKEMLKEK